MSTSDGDTACDIITIVDDDVLEGEHSFEIQISSTNPQLSNINPASTMMTIQDNEGSVVILNMLWDIINIRLTSLQMQQSHW